MPLWSMSWVNEWDLVYDYFEWTCNYQQLADTEYEGTDGSVEFGEMEPIDFENTSDEGGFVEPSNSNNSNQE